ncbi:MAG: ATP-dependent DNA helicase RecG [Coriobacteriia bacterium]|nr:ATP-dependent DNA helicase RecG [Coriobacteriia bacterium]
MCPDAQTRDRAYRLAAHEAPVADARFVDGTRAAALSRLGISTIGGLLRHYPMRYLDLTDVTTLRDARSGSEVTVVGRVHEVRVKKPRPRLTITEVAIVDGTGVLLGVWFNQPYIQQRFAAGDRVAFAGKVELDYGFKQIKTPFVEKLAADQDDAEAGRVLPVHPATEGLSTAWLRRLVAAVVDDYSDVCDHIPAALRSRRGLVPLHAALRDVHFPATRHDSDAARLRLTYDELLLLQLYMGMRRHSVTREQAGIAHRLDGAALAALRGAIRFDLTGDQIAAIHEVLFDMSEPRPMNRLLLGDVGTGKTVIAAHALAVAADAGAQGAMMAPTEVLAQQYANAVGPLLDAANVTWALLTGSTPAAQRRETLTRLAEGELSVAFGTHALLEDSVMFKRLSVAIVDEQHRFGVNQRLGLRGKGASADLLVMTATPIPRSLALTLYGDLEPSYLRERPNSRAPVRTTVLKPAQRDRAYERVRAAVRAGQQAFVVCALVDESESAAATKAANREAERLSSQVFSDLRVGLLTGRMRSAEKLRTMSEFRDGVVDVLVATTVIEVGIDVPNATVMIIEDADRFGLAQLHQLRGRVGRGEEPGEVYLLADPRSAEGKERMQAIASTEDGFALAEHDLRLRGEGHILGDRQHGLPALRLASVLDHAELIAQARADAVEIIDSDPHLTSPEHRPLLAETKRVYREAWKWVSSG